MASFLGAVLAKVIKAVGNATIDKMEEIQDQLDKQEKQRKREERKKNARQELLHRTQSGDRRRKQDAPKNQPDKKPLGGSDGSSSE